MTEYSIILPVFNEEYNILPLYSRIRAVLKKSAQTYEIIFINDGSTDNTLAELLKLHSDKDKHIKIISFSRNFGHQSAVAAGLMHCSGAYVAILDADLQDPPEVLPQFFKKLDEGFDVVYAVRTKRKEGLFKKSAYAIFYRLLKTISSIDIPLDSGDFCVMKKRVVDVMNSMPERNRFIRGLRSWTGFKQTGITYERDQRFKGTSKYTFKKLTQLAVDGILSFSYVPLRLMTFIGFLAFLSSIIGSFAVIYFKFFTDYFVPGFPTTVILIIFSGGLIMLGLGIIGEYLARIYDEVKQRPSYVIESKIGF